MRQHVIVLVGGVRRVAGGDDRARALEGNLQRRLLAAERLEGERETEVRAGIAPNYSIGVDSSALAVSRSRTRAPGFGARDEKSARPPTSSSAVASFSRADREVCTTATILSVGEPARHARRRSVSRDIP